MLEGVGDIRTIIVVEFRSSWRLTVIRLPPDFAGTQTRGRPTALSSGWTSHGNVGVEDRVGAAEESGTD